MSKGSIKSRVNAIVDRFDNSSSLDNTKTLMREAKAVVEQFYEEQLQTNGEPLAQVAGRKADEIHRVTEEHFGFNVYEQPSYSSIDDFAWESSQRYTTLEGVDLPSNSRFFDSQRRSLSRGEVEKIMANGEHHLFDIALSNEYVLLGANEEFSVRDLEQRFSTNNEHLSPQSKSRQEGGTRVFKSDPRVIVISDMDNNSKRGNLQVVFLDEKGHARDSVSLLTDEETQEAVLVQNNFSLKHGGARYGIGPEDAPHYAYALALTHFGNGFSAADDRNWFDKRQAQEVTNMLYKLAEQPVDANKEPVMRDILSDAKVLGGRINPVALLPEAFAEALQAEINKNKFRSHMAQPEAEAPQQTAEATAKPAAPKIEAQPKATSHLEALLRQRENAAGAELAR